MKRLFGLIGLTYLSVLTVVYYLYSRSVIIFVITASVLIIAVGVVFEIIRHKRNGFGVKIGRELVTAGISAVCACLAIILFTNNYYNPLIEKYSDKELNISGYVCDEVLYRESSCTYTVKTTQINGKAEKLKLSLVSYYDLKIAPFDCVNMKAAVQGEEYNWSLGRGIYFKAYTDENFELAKTGEKHISAYSAAVFVREKLKYSFDMLLPEDCASVCKAVLIGDKNSLSAEIRGAFSDTGASFLIVVSGFHLAVITSFVLFLLRRLTHNRIIICLSVCFTVFVFASVTGFNPSVVRSGIMTALTYCASILFRKSDSINSIGIAALVLALPNPYAPADVGLLLSFSATIGIVLWADKIYVCLNRYLRLRRKFLKSGLRLIAVSISASVWVMPITILVFGRVSPLVVLVSFLAEPAVSMLLMLSLAACVIYFIPILSFLSYPFALACGIISRYLLTVVTLISKTPYSSLKADKSYFYIWIAVSLVFVLIGYIIMAKGGYVRLAVIISFCVISFGSVIDCIIDDNCPRLTVYSAGSGVTAAVSSDSGTSFISCGGTNLDGEELTQNLRAENLYVNYIIIPENNYRYSRYESEIIEEFDADNILVYDIDNKTLDYLEEYDGQTRSLIPDNARFGIELSKGVKDTVLSLDGVVYQLLSSGSTSVLFVPAGGDIAMLPKDFLGAEYVLIDSIPKNAQLLSGKTIIYSGNSKNYSKNYNELKTICDNVKTTADTDIVISLNGGYNGKEN